MEKILTIVIPTYNMQDYLRRCLDSLIVSEEQMNQLEVLVINDGSKDNSSAIAHEYQDKYPDTFRVIDKGNGNYGSCINRGLKEATGKYIKVLDADDWFDNNNFSQFISVLIGNNADLFVTPYNVVNEAGIITGAHKFNLPSEKILSFAEAMNDSKFHKIAMHAVTYRTNILKEIAYSQAEGISYTDNEWIFKPMLYVTTVFYSNLDVYQYLIGREGQTMSSSALIKNVKHHLIGCENMIKSISGIDIKDEAKSKYINEKLLSRTAYVYRMYLTENVENGHEDICEFDKFINFNAPSLYRALEDVTLGNRNSLRFIKKWRESGYKEKFIFYKCYLRIKRILCK